MLNALNIFVRPESYLAEGFTAKYFESSAGSPLRVSHILGLRKRHSRQAWFNKAKKYLAQGQDWLN